MTEALPAVLQYGALGLLALVLVGAFWLMRWAIGRLDVSLGTHTAAMDRVAEKLAEGETRAVARHGETREWVKQQNLEAEARIVARITSEAKATRQRASAASQAAAAAACDHAEALIYPLQHRFLGARREPPRPFAAARPPAPSIPDDEEEPSS